MLKTKQSFISIQSITVRAPSKIVNKNQDSTHIGYAFMKAEHVNRVARLRKKFARDEAILVAGPENLRYLCGFSGTEGLLVLAGGRSFFLTDSRYATQAAEQVSATDIIIFKDRAKELARIVKRSGISKLCFDSRQLTVAQLEDFEKNVPGLSLSPRPEPFETLRAIKNAGELQLLERAAEIAATGLALTLPFIRPGASEIDIAAELEYRMRKCGASGASFPTIVASGPRSAMPHGVASPRLLSPGDIVLVDYGCVYEGYSSDETCTFFLGEPSKRFRQIYEIVKSAHDRAIAALAPGAALREVDGAARTFIAAQGYGRRFGHGTGHGIGLCVHEAPTVSPRATLAAEQGMVVTIEPGIYLPGRGGVRIEDTVAVTASGCRTLTKTGKNLRVLG